MHDEIRRFPLDGEIKDDDLVERKTRFIHFVEGMMRDEGYVRVLELEPQFTLNYNAEKESFDFQLSVYGIFVGVNEAWTAEGVSNGKMIMKSTPPTK